MKIEEILKVAFINASVAKGVGELWQKITDRLKGKSDAKKILDRIPEEEMNKNPQFAEEITRLAQESNNTSAGDAIEIEDLEVRENAVVIGKLEAKNPNIGGTNIYVKESP